MSRWPGLAMLAMLALLAALASAQAQVGDRNTPSAASAQGEPVRGPVLEDRDFGVRSEQFGLDRQVEMFQWYRDGQDSYARVWKPALVDASGFAPGHENPRVFPLESRRWWASQASLDGKPLDLSVLKALGQWQDFRPGFSRLPANLAATFQPEGDGLGSSDNPLDPQIGDLRIRWRELHLPPLAGRVELHDGRWHLSARTEKAALNAQPLPPVPADPPLAGEGSRSRWRGAGGIALALAGVFFVVLLVRRKR